VQEQRGMNKTKMKPARCSSTQTFWDKQKTIIAAATITCLLLAAVGVSGCLVPFDMLSEDSTLLERLAAVGTQEGCLLRV